MKIAIDARMYNESGIGRYIRNLISHLEKLDDQNEYLILHLKSDYDTLIYHNNFKKVLADFRWYGISEQVKLYRLLNSLRPNLVHFPHFNVPIFYQGKFVVTIHDLIHQHFSMQRLTTHGPFIYKLKQFGYKKVFLHAIGNSEKILVPSRFVKNQLMDEWEMNEIKIVITPEAVDDRIQTIVAKMSTVKVDQILGKFNIKLPYIFYVGNAHPHKNVEGLIKVFLLLKENHKNLRLVLSGADHYFWQRIRTEYENEDIIYTGHILDEDLVVLYKAATSFVMPSFEEGFGIPILEAMVCGCPVVSSEAGALTEVGGDACLYFDPHNLGDMRDKVDRVLNNENLRNDLIRKGQKRVKLFSWERLSKTTLEEYLRCM